MDKIYAERTVPGVNKKLTRNFDAEIWNTGVPKKNGWVQVEKPVTVSNENKKAEAAK